MYVIFEYLSYLAIVSFLGLTLFGVTVLGLVIKTGTSKLADQLAPKVLQLATHLHLHEPRLKKAETRTLAHSH